jgi:serine/threonine protein kinase
VNYRCDLCHKTFALDKQATFCPYCGTQIGDTIHHTLTEEVTTATSIYTPPKPEEVQFSLGHYKIVGNLAKGGMGEVLLAFDPVCGRRIALKRIREDFQDHPALIQRFMKEARITAQLTHPSIIPIYQIYPGDGKSAYYTMPYVEGKTLKQFMRDIRVAEKEGIKSEGGSIPAFMRIFLSICQAVAYAHSFGVLHRDLKPENIIVGKYGQVLILDWGLAKVLEDHANDPEAKQIHENPSSITHVGKVVGTISYMAPERALGEPATTQTDIYSLGVILYQFLTLRFPFKRESLKEFRKNMKNEILHDPSEVAPYRDVPRLLSAVVTKCLSPIPEHRHNAVDELINDIENFLEGRAEWYEVDSLDIADSSDWEFQENVLIPENLAVTQGTDSDWVILMVSRESYSENVRIETRVRIGETGKGIGFLLSVPETSERSHPHDGYCLWLSATADKNTKLLRSSVEVMPAPDVMLKRGEWYTVRLDKIDNNIHCYLNDQLQFSYISYLPLVGTHVGLLTRDTDFAITPINISVGGQNVKVSCLAIPDAFLAHKDYNTALSEYRRIGYAFSGRQEGREAMFRAGITLLEQARNCANREEAETLFNQALEEFSKQHRTSGAPLEYLGKGLVYRALHDYEEEAKCYELALRRYTKHPLLHVLHEQVIYRMHESSRYHPKATYNFILLTLRLLPQTNDDRQTKRLFENLQNFWEPLPFIERDPSSTNFAIQLAFWLAKAHVLVEIVEASEEPVLKENALFCLIALGAYKLAEQYVDDHSLLQILVDNHNTPIEHSLDTFFSKVSNEWTKRENRILLYLLEDAIDQRKTAVIHNSIEKAGAYHCSDEMKLHLNCLNIWAYLLEKDWTHAGELLQNFPVELLTREKTLLHFLYGCWLQATEAAEIAEIHFHSVLEAAYPRTWTLASHYIKGDIKEPWLRRAFIWDRRQLFRQLSLYYVCLGDEITAKAMKEKMDQEVLPPDPFDL